MFTKTYSRSEVEWVVKQNLKMPREYAAALLYNHSTQDWRRVIPRITLPTLVVGGRVSVVPWKSQVWIQKQVRGTRTSSTGSSVTSWADHKRHPMARARKTLSASIADERGIMRRPSPPRNHHAAAGSEWWQARVRNSQE
jgi:hypothetical protein